MADIRIEDSKIVDQYVYERNTLLREIAPHLGITRVFSWVHERVVVTDRTRISDFDLTISQLSQISQNLGVPLGKDELFHVVLERMRQKRVSDEGLRPGVPCGHPGCFSHVSHPCEGCGRIAGVYDAAEAEKIRVFGACGGKCGEEPCIEWNKKKREHDERERERAERRTRKQGPTGDHPTNVFGARAKRWNALTSDGKDPQPDHSNCPKCHGRKTQGGYDIKRGGVYTEPCPQWDQGGVQYLDKFDKAAYEEEIAKLRHELLVLNRWQRDGYWRWQPDGGNDLKSLTCPIVIMPRELEELIGKFLNPILEELSK